MYAFAKINVLVLFIIMREDARKGVQFPFQPEMHQTDLILTPQLKNHVRGASFL